MNRRTDSVYILTNHPRTLYIGVTSDLARRLYEHRAGLVPGFTRRYHVHQLVYYEAFLRRAPAGEGVEGVDAGEEGGAD